MFDRALHLIGFHVEREMDLAPTRSSGVRRFLFVAERAFMNGEMLMLTGASSPKPRPAVTRLCYGRQADDVFVERGGTRHILDDEHDL